MTLNKLPNKSPNFANEVQLKLQSSPQNFKKVMFFAGKREMAKAMSIE